MKTQIVAALLFSVSINLHAQSAASAPATAQVPDTSSQDTPYAIVENDANSRVWERTTYEQLPSGELVPHIHRFQEVATGLNFKNPDTGQWEESSEAIEPVAGGAIARHGQHKVVFAADIATFGAVDLETPDGQRLQSHLLGLCYYDRASGQSVFIAEITNSIGQLISTNQIWYDNAFAGVKAGVRYTYTREGFEQDVILEEQPPAPEAYGLNSATTVLQAFTEFISPPTPAISMALVTADPGDQLMDETLSFSAMKIGRGRAFLMGNDDAKGTPVVKQWTAIEGRQFLIEEVPMPQIAADLQTLPPSQNAVIKTSNSVLNVVSARRLVPPPPLATAGTKSMKIASLSAVKSGLVLDYASLNTSQTNYIFRGDTTYYISGNVNLYGTNTTFEGGTVIKYASGYSLNVNTPIKWLGTAYRPILMLAKDDNSSAETLPGSTGSPGTSYYATKALSFDGTSALTNLTIQNLRVLNANAAVVINGQSNNVLSDLQVINCADGVSATNADFSVRNALFSIVRTNFTGASATGHVEHLTSDVAIWLNKDIGTNLFLTNCIFSAVTNLGSCTTQSVAVVSSGTGVFQPVGAGGYYLTNNSPYRDAGTTNINPALLTQLGRKTTYPPVLVLNSNFNAVTTLGPTVQRDTNTPDLGYHYDPMDYVMSGVNVNTNVTVAAGTSIGWFKPSGGLYAVHLADKQILTFAGREDAQDYWVRTSTVQEGNGVWGGISGLGIVGSQNQGSENVSLSSEIDMNFTTMSVLIWDQQFRDYAGYLIVRANNSIFAGGNCGGYVISCYFTNCLMDNQQVGTVQGHTGNEIYLRNCTLHNGLFYGQRSMAIPISVRDCAFDQVTLYGIFDSYSTNSTNTDYNYNAYTNAIDPFPNPTGITNDQKSVAFNWQTGPLGRFYLPTNSVLIDAGHTNANLVGLYHFTTQTNQVKETNSIVDIGYHYVALDGFGNPDDTDGDGIPDYIEDANGNGRVDAGESSWLLGIITQPQSQNIVQGQNVTFSVVAGGSTPFSYQWRSNGTDIAGATSSSFTKLVVTTNDEANYSVVVTNFTGAVTSSIAALTVNTPLQITTQPSGQTALEGTNVSFSVGISGNYPVFRWYTNGVPVNNSSHFSGATTSTLTVSNVTVADQVSYTVVVTNLFNSVTSSPAGLTVIAKPGISSGPTNTTAIQSDDVTLSAVATGASLYYQWWLTNSLGTNSISGATQSSYAKLVVQTNDAGHYCLVITNLAGSTNANADLTVLVPPWIIQQPTSVLTNQGSNVTFTVSATGTTNLYYQWYKNGTNAIANATNSSLTLNSVQAPDATGYSCLVTNVAGTNISAWAWLSVILSGGGTTNGWGSGSSPSSAITVAMIGPTNSSPTNPAIYLYGPAISIRASAFSQYAYITNVAFYYTGTNYTTNFLLAGTAVPGANTKFALAWTNALPGTNILKARAWDCNGNTNDSTLVYVIMDQAPQITNSPSSISATWEGFTTNLWFTNYISDDGLPYGITNLYWNIPAGVTLSNFTNYTSGKMVVTTMATFTNWGTYALRLDASDNFVTNSSTCTVTLKHRPVVYFNSPTNNSAFLSTAPIVLNATAFDPDGTVTNVMFYDGTNLTTIGKGIPSVSSTYTYAWYGASLWTHLVTAVATDDSGLTSATNINLVVVPPLDIRFISPTNNQFFVLSPTNIVLSALLTNYAGSTVSSVIFSNVTQSIYLGSGTLTNSTYQALWTDVTNGNYTVSVTALDNSGNVASNGVAITVNAMPVVSIITPTNLQSFAEITNVQLIALASDAEDGTNVSVSFYCTNFLIGNGVHTVGSSNSFIWTGRTANSHPSNSYPIVAVATDSHGASSASQIVVFNVTPTNLLPSVAITYPTNGSVFPPGSEITIMATATNYPASVTNVEFFVNGESIGDDPNDPYSVTKCCWESGDYTLVAKATDNRGISGFSTNVLIAISKKVPAGQGFWDPAFHMPDSSDWSYTLNNVSALRVRGKGVYVGGFFYYRLYDGYGDLVDDRECMLNWDGTNWNGMGILSLEPYNILVFGTNVYASSGGAVSCDTCQQGVALWDGGNDKFIGSTNGDWQQVGTNMNNNYPSYDAMAVVGSDRYASFNFSYHVNPAAYVNYVAKWNPAITNWEKVGDFLNGDVYAIASIGNRLFIGGSFTAAGGNTNANYIAELNGNTWTNLGAGLNGTNVDEPTDTDGYERNAVRALAPCGTNLFVGGGFTQADGNTNANGIAIWNGYEWRAIRSGLDAGTNGDGSLIPAVVRTITPRGNTVFVGGQFTRAKLDAVNTLPTSNIASAIWNEDAQHWNWNDLDFGVSGGVGTSYFGTSYDTAVLATAIMEGPTPNSYDLIVGGDFDYAGADPISTLKIARWRVGGAYPTNLPTVSIIAPANNTVFTNPASISLVSTAAVTDVAFTISSVDFRANGVLVGTASSPGMDGNYSFSWATNSTPPLTPGTYTLTAVANAIDIATFTKILKQVSKPVVFKVVDTNQSQTIVANNDVFTVFANSSAAALPVLTNDYPASGLTISQVGQSPTAYGGYGTGSASIGHDGTYLVFTPTPFVFGTNYLWYAVTNSSGAVGEASATVFVRVPPIAQILSPTFSSITYTSPVSSLTISGSTYDWDGVVTNVTLFTNGVACSTTTPTGTNFSFTWSASTPGFYKLNVVARDNDGYTNGSAGESITGAEIDIDVKVNPSTSPGNHLPVAIINTPIQTTNGLGGASVTWVRDGQLALTGSAYDVDGDPVSYQTRLLDPSHPDASPLYNVTPGILNAQGFHQGPVTNASLGTLDLSLVENGSYLLELVVHGGGDEVATSVLIGVDSQLKIGQFSFSEQDLVLPVNGIPLTVTRTYNSLNPRSGPFGNSWSFALNDMDVQLDDERTDVTIGSANTPFADDEESDNGLPKVVNVRTGGGWDVTLTLPDGRRVTFPFEPRRGDNVFYAEWGTPAGVEATLTVDPSSYIIYDYPSLHWGDSDMAWGTAPLENHDIKGWILQTQDGIKYHITRGNGNHVTYDPDGSGHYVDALVYSPPKLTEIDELSTNKIVINDNGIFNYDPTNALTRWTLFDRDSAGRIVALHDPNGGSNGLPVVKYVYNNDTGNLIQVLKLVDRNASTYTTNKYHYDNLNFPHYITSIENGDGIPVARNFYDDSGRLTAVQDADGNLTQFNHSLTNNSEAIIDRRGYTNTYVYDLKGNVTAQTNQLGQVTTISYDDNNNKTNEVVFLNGQPYATNQSVYDTNNFLLASTDPLGHSNTFAYNVIGEVTVSTDALGHSTTNVCNGSGNLLSTADAFGNTTLNSYNGGLLLGSTDAAGTLTTNTYDGNDSLIGTAMIDGSGGILSSNSFTYDENGNRLTSTIWRRVSGTWVGATTTNVYDAMNRVVQTIGPGGGTNTRVYDAVGKQQATVDTLGRTTSYTYDSQGRLVQTTYPDNTTEQSIFDANGNRIGSVDRAGRLTTYIYDALNRVTQTVYPDSTTNTTVYDGAGRAAQTVDGCGTITALAYDVAGRQLAVTNAFNAPVQMVSQYTYDANGNQTVFTDAANHSTTNVFDVLNRQVQVQYANGTFSSTGFDSVGRRVSETNQDGFVTLFGYDGAGRLVAVTNALGKIEQMVTRYQYDEAGNEAAQVDALGRTNQFTYDGLGRRVSHTMPDTNLVERFGYDLGGNMVYQTNFLGVIITNRYDVLNRLTNRVSVNGYQASFRYNAAGQRTNLTDVSGATSYTYDNRDRLTNKVVSWTGGPSVSLNYRFDANGSLTNLWSGTSGGVTNVYQYDALSRLTNVLAGGSAAAGYGFDAVGNLQSVRYGSGVTNQYQYDSLNRLTNLVWKLNASTLASFYYQLGLTGNRTNLSETVNGTSRTYGWQYNNLYQLTNESISGAGNVSYRLDPVGNRTNRTSSISGLGNQAFAFNTNDWLTADNYDKNGNTTNSSGTLYQYDALNHLTNSNSGAVLFVYDGDGNRVAKTLSGTTTYYLLDDRNPSGYVQVLEEYQGSSLSRVYNYGLQLVSEKQSGTISYYGYDGHGSVRMLTDTSGSLTDTYAYDAYGTIIAPSGSTQNSYLYCGEQYDPNLGMYYLRARYYKPDTGRFWTMDTYEGVQEDPLSLHKYLYCQGNPVNNLDPSGNDVGELLAISDIFSELDSLANIASAFATRLHHIRTVTIQTYISRATVWGFAGDNHGPTDHPSTAYRTTSTITFDDEFPNHPAKIASDTGISKKLSTGATGKASAAGLRGEEKWESPGVVFVYMIGHAKDPLTIQVGTPSAQYELALNVDFKKGECNGFLVSTKFPSCQLFVDDQRVYSYVEQGGPLNLFFGTEGFVHGKFKP